MKIKLAMMASFSVILLAAALLWLMDEKISEQRNAALEGDLRGSVMSLTRALQADLRGLRRSLPAGTNLQRERMDWTSFQPFFALAQIRFTGSSAEILQFASQPNGRGGDWRSEDLQKMLLPFKKNPAAANGASLSILTHDPQRPVLAVFWRDGERTWLGLSGPEFLQAFLDLQKNAESTYAVMNAAGEILAHSTPEYVGTKISAGSLYAEVLSSADARSYREFPQGADGPSLGAFEKVPRTDVTVLAFRSVAQIRAERMKTLLFGGLATAGLLLVAVSGVWWIASRAEKDAPAPLPATRAAAAPLAPPVVSAAAVKPAAVSSVTKTNSVSADVPLRIASALGHDLKGPLVSILGYCQMILASSKDERITEPVESILRETRSARSVLDKLLVYAGEKESVKKPSRLEALIFKVLKDEQSKFQRKHVKVLQDIKETSAIPLAEEDLEKALRHLLENAVEAMDRMPKKEISVKLSEEPDSIRIEIKDSGEGIEPEKLSQVMDPFFTTRTGAGHLGLGLSAALGIIREHEGELKLESKRGQGTTATITLPKAAKKVQIGDRQVILKTEEKVEIPSELPPLRAEAPAATGARSLTPPAVAPLELSDAEDPPSSGETNGEGESSSSTPADLDLDQLFSMDSAPAPAKAPEAAGKTARESSEDSGDKTVVLPVDASMHSRADEKIKAPSFQAPKKKSRLDEVSVSIRRPGSRLE